MDNIQKAIDALVAKIDKAINGGDAMQYSQAILNLAHANARLNEQKNPQ